MITERVMGAGKWSIRLRDDTPRAILDMIALESRAFGHIVITPTHVESSAISDADLLAKARFTGVLRVQDGDFGFGGGGTAFWLGDEDEKGNILNATIAQTNANLTTWVNALRPPALLAGTTASPATLVTQSFIGVTPKNALDTVCDTMGAEWRVNPNFTLDAGLPSALYPTTPTVVVIRNKGEAGHDQGITGVLGSIDTKRDVEDYATQIMLVTKGTASTETVTTATAATVPYRDPQGNALVLKSRVSATQVETSNATPLAAQNLAKVNLVRREITLDSEDYDIGSDVKVGNPIWVYDLLAGLTDTAQEIQYRGRTIHPMTTRVLGYTWPVKNGLGVYFRWRDGSAVTTTDLTPYMVWEDGRTTIEIGASPRASTA